MTHHDREPQMFVVYGDPASWVEGYPVPEHSGSRPMSEQKVDSGFSSAQKSGAFPHAQHAEILSRRTPGEAYDPYLAHRRFPERWSAYIRANYAGLHHVQQVFNVSERTARKWWNGETGANGGHVAIAMNETPVQAQRMLFAAE